MNKRGIVFTSIAIILVSIIIIVFLIQANKKTEIEITKSTVQTDTLNSFVKSLKTEYIPSAIRISSDRALLGLIDYIDREDYLTNVNTDFNKSLLSGKGPDNGNLQYMFEVDENNQEINYTIYAALNEIKDLSAQTQIIFSYNPVSAKIEQEDSWTLKITLENFQINVSSSDGKVKWSDKVNISGYIPITNYRDPVILVEEGLNFTIMKADMTDYVTPLEGLGMGGEFDNLDKISNQMWNHTFNNNSDAPSFLQRMEGNFTNPEGHGIEYIVNPAFNSNPSDLNMIDHYYHPEITQLQEDICFIEELGKEFRIDKAHLIYYGFTQNEIINIMEWCSSESP
ncbi:MAG: hypothetical protein V1663_03550 [archaeon]